MGISGINGNNFILPAEYKLYQNYPNPFNPSTNIKFDLPEQTKVSLKIFDILGTEITVIYNGILSGGSYNFMWDASSYASGVYFYKLVAGDYIEVRKMTLIK